MSENQHAPCPFCGGTKLMIVSLPGYERKKFVLCRNDKCETTGPQRTADTETEAIAAAWEAWDAAGKREEAK